MATDTQRASAECKYLERTHRELVPQEFLADNGLFGRARLMTDIVLRAADDSLMMGIKKLMLYDRILLEANTISPLQLDSTLPTRKDLTDQEKLELSKISCQVLYGPKARNWLLFYVTIQQAIIEIERHYMPPTQGSVLQSSCPRSFGGWVEIMHDSMVEMQKKFRTHSLDLTHGSPEWWISRGHFLFGKLTQSIGTDERRKVHANARQFAKDYHREMIDMILSISVDK